MPSWVVYRRLGEEAVLLQLQKGLYYALNPSAVRIYERLSSGIPGGQAVSELSEEYGVERSSLEADVGELLQALLAQDLLEPIAAG